VTKPPADFLFEYRREKGRDRKQKKKNFMENQRKASYTEGGKKA
jgi:hypothetical protein